MNNKNVFLCSWFFKLYECTDHRSESTTESSKLSSSSKLSMALDWILKEKGAILIMEWFKIIIRPTHESVLLFSRGAEPADQLVLWYCSVSGVDNKLYTPIQNQINFCFQSPGGKRGPRKKNSKFREKIQDRCCRWQLIYQRLMQ